MKKCKFLVAILLGLMVLGGTIPAYAYSSGFCQKNGCYCHQYVGDNGKADGNGPCKTCGHSKAAHS